LLAEIKSPASKTSSKRNIAEQKEKGKKKKKEKKRSRIKPSVSIIQLHNDGGVDQAENTSDYTGWLATETLSVSRQSVGVESSPGGLVAEPARSSSTSA
jgi:hypothetical protein